MSRGGVWGRRIVCLALLVGFLWALRSAMLRINDRRFAEQRLPR